MYMFVTCSTICCISYSGFISRGKTFVVWTSANVSRLNFREYALCRTVTYSIYSTHCTLGHGLWVYINHTHKT